jgi:NAD(P)-dependent dehydrogenase (short-subunit alcohol dehydrogenase family)
MNKVAIVTGASRGIGAATAKLLASRGYLVVVNFLANTREATRVVDDIVNCGGRAIAVQADVSNEHDVANLFNTAEKEFGTVTHLVNNVGKLFQQARLVEMELERFNQLMQCNVTSCFFMLSRVFNTK